MTRVSQSAVFATATLLAAFAVPGHANSVFTNNGGTGLWSDSSNWNGGNVADNGEVAQINPAGVEVDTAFTISRLQNSFGTQTQRIRGNGTLTIDTNAGSATQALVNVAGNAGGLMEVDTNVVVDNSQGAFSVIRNNNSGNNVLEFGDESTLTLNTNAEIQQGVGGAIQFNGAIAGGGNLRVLHNNVSFGATSDNSAFTGELVVQGNADLTVDTAAGNTFFGGSKLQVNGNATLTLNGEQVIANTPLIGFGGSPTLNLNVNSNQAFGNIALSGGNLNLTLGNGVTDLDFLPSAAFAWNGGLNIDNFTPGVVGFGFDGGLTAQQIGLITIDGNAPASPLSLNEDGRLISGLIAGLLGDYDESGQVEQGDLNLVLNNWGTNRTFEDPGGTAFSTSLVDQEELNLVLNNWGSASVPNFEGSALPEPAAALAVLGLVGTCLRRRIA
ncbi:MAG: hypothetical protein AAGJ38_00385 [Planctomycetota bacterium]